MEVTEYLLNESHAIYIAAKSNTLKANQLLQKVIAAFLAARRFIHKMLTAPLDQAMKELTESRQVFQEEQERLIKENERLKALTVAAPTAVNISGLQPGERAMVTKIIDTSNAMYLRQVNEEFGFPTSGKHSRMLVSVAQKFNVWGQDGFFVAVPIDMD